MLVNERRQQVNKALQAVGNLSREERQSIVGLDLPIYDSLVIAHLKLAHHLLERDQHFDWKTRELCWHTWRSDILQAIEGGLRYRENEPLIVALGVCSALFPVVHRGAWLMAYKTIDDVVWAAQRAGYSNKRERSKQRLRVKDIMTRVTVWVLPSGEIELDRDVPFAGRASIQAQGAVEAAAVLLDYSEAQQVTWLVNSVIPITWHSQGPHMLITPAA